MRLFMARRPPMPSILLSWRELYAGGAFGQRELVEDGRLRSAAQERGFELGIGQETLEDLDQIEAFSPVAFSAGYMSGFDVPAQPVEELKFREEQPPLKWREYAWSQDGFEIITALFSPWQLLYLDDVVRATTVEIGVEAALLPSNERGDRLERLRRLLEPQLDALRSLQETWSPTIKLLVALQNRYMREFTGSFTVIGVPNGGWLFAGREWAEQGAAGLLNRIGCTSEEVTALYEFLLERGLARDPNDGLTMLRRAHPRAFHKRWRGDARRAQDNFDAAELFRRFLTELGEPPGRPSVWPMDGRQIERFALYDRGPAAPWERDEIKGQLRDADLYPGGVRVICEGLSEEIIVQRLAEALLDSDAVHALEFFDLGGSGSAKRIGPLWRSFSADALSAFVIVDNEGEMARYLRAEVQAGDVDEADLMLFDESLEGSNATAEELIALAKQLGENPPPDREPVSFELTPDELLRCHADRRNRCPPNGKPGIAESLIVLVHRKTEGRLHLDKLDLAEALATMLVDELQHSERDQWPALCERRPVVKFFLERIAPILSRPRPVGSEI
jgi:hypothetical protein